jgi:hypothetical protein
MLGIMMRGLRCGFSDVLKENDRSTAQCLWVALALSDEAQDQIGEALMLAYVEAAAAKIEIPTGKSEGQTKGVTLGRV